MDTTILEQTIKNLDQEIIDKQKAIDLLKEGISMAKKAKKIYEDGLEKIKSKNAD